MWRDALAGILHFQPDPVVFVPAAQGDAAELFDGVGGVDQQVHHHLVDLRGHALHRRQLAVFLDHFGLVLELVIDHVEGGVEAAMQVGEAEFILFEMGKILERGDDLLDPLDAILGFTDQCLDIVADVVVLQAALELAQLVEAGCAIHRVDDAQQVMDVAGEGLQVGEHIADRVVDLMRHASGELADGGEFFRLHELGIGFFQLGDQQFLLDLLAAQGMQGRIQLFVVAGEFAAVVQQQAQ
ncbi:hypothetical protein D3C86_1511220 [compost metagenome]